MPRYTETVELAFNELNLSRPANAEVSDITVNQWNGAAFVPAATVIPADSSVDLVTQGLRLQFVIAPGGALNIEGGV